MTAYVVADIHIKDATSYDEYRRGVAATLSAFGGRFLARGGAARLVEGAPEPGRVVIIEFPDMAALEAWYKSTDYAPLLAIRLAASDGRLIAVEGV